jgi:hypothetical protein
VTLRVFSQTDVPQLAIVRVHSAGGPYAENDILSLAFATPSVCRIVRHGESQVTVRGADTSHGAESIVPDTISASIIVAAGPYAAGDELTLSFLDPKIARIHLSPLAARRVVRSETGLGMPRMQQSVSEPRVNAPHETEAAEDAGPSMLAAQTRLVWTSDRAQRFVQVCDRLFTVERLGWYRHAFAMRLLLPDAIVCGEAAVDRDIADDLRLLAESATETLGHPMLTAFMPSFSVTSEWLESLDNAVAAKSLSHLRATLMQRAPARTFGEHQSSDVRCTAGTILIDELMSVPVGSAEALLPLLIANVSPLNAVTEKLTAYRAALTELFGQTAGSAEPVRLSQMALPNHTLDDRLWHLVGVVSDEFVAPPESHA